MQNFLFPAGNNFAIGKTARANKQENGYHYHGKSLLTLSRKTKFFNIFMLSQSLKFLRTALCAGAAALMSLSTFAQQGEPVLWYQTPASDWMEGVPVGNGRMAAIVYGGIDTERIALNEITLWAGQRDTMQNSICTPENLAEIRSHFLAGDFRTGNELTDKYLSGKSSSFGTHLPLGDLVIQSKYPAGALTDYRRELNLSDGVSRTSFKKGDITFSREVICNYPDDITAVKISADKPGSINTTLSFNLLRNAEISADANGITLKGKVDYPMFGPGGVNFFLDMRLTVEGGSVSPATDRININGADRVEAFIDIRTDMFDPDYQATAKNTAKNGSRKGYDTLLANHVADHKPLFDRMKIELGNTDMSHLPTDVRLHLIKNGAQDPDFDALFFQYGRYMLIASSRPNSPLCGNLQGVWNDNRACKMAWTCDYHLDINIQQNYWSANKANLAECNVPLFTYVDLLRKYGSETARKIYGSRGWVAHTVTNPWGYTAPGGNVGWGLNVTGGAWLATHLWSHYKYTLDKDYLAKTGYPLLKSTAEFFADYMIEDPATGQLLTGPSISPENGYVTPEGYRLSAAMMPTIDRAVVHDIYTACIESSKILGIDKAFRRQLEKDIKKLPPLEADNDGQVKEWLHGHPRQDPAHRHTSHLLALYPLGQISYVKTPGLIDAAKLTIEKQTSAPGWEDVEWSAANMLCFNSFLKDGEKAHYWLQDLFKYFTRENLMTVSPKGIAGAPEDIFSFDATEASVAGMCDMLMQSHDGFIEFLPALPAAWAEGSVKGICAEGNITGDLAWAGGRMTSASLTAGSETVCRIAIPEGATTTFILNGKSVEAKADKDNTASFNMKPSDRLDIAFNNTNNN